MSGDLYRDVPVRPARSRRMSGPRRRSLGRPHGNTVAHGQAAAKNVRRELDRRECPRRHRDAPGTEPLQGLQHAAVAAHERHVNRKSHEESVYGVAGRQDERMVFGKPSTPEQPASPGRRFDGGLEPTGHDSTRSLVDERPGLVAGLDQTAEKVAHAVLTAGSSEPTFVIGILRTGSIGRATVTCPERNSRKFTVQPCVASRFRNRL